MNATAMSPGCRAARTRAIRSSAAPDRLGEELAATARAYHTTALTLPAGHDMMLDTAWEQAATAIETAIVERHAHRRVRHEGH